MFKINKDKLFLFSDISQYQLLTNIILTQYVDNIIKCTTPLEFSAKKTLLVSIVRFKFLLKPL